MDIIGNRTLPQVLREQAGRYPEKAFIVFEDATGIRITKTYAEFFSDVISFSRSLFNLGIRKGDHFTVHLPNNPEFLAIWFAAAELGAVMVPTNILSTADEMKYLITHSDSVLLITEEEHLAKFDTIKNEIPAVRHTIVTRSKGPDHTLSFEQLVLEGRDLHMPLPEVHPEDVVGMLYTSGTTSRPKGVQVTNANYIFTGELMSKTIGLTPEDRTFTVLPMFHGNAQYYTCMPALIAGGSIALTERFSASRYFKQAKALGGTVGSLFAAPIRMILSKDYDPADRDNPLRLILFAQSVGRQELDEFESRYDTRLYQLYGMTETVGIPLMNQPYSMPNNLSIGRPTLGYEVKLIDEAGKEVQEGSAGQIAVKGTPGRTIMKGYFKNPEATEAAVRDGWLMTGDNARLGDDGNFYFVDRLKDMIKRSGENVAAGEVESVLTDHAAVYEAAVVGVPDPIKDESIKAFVILHAGAEATSGELIAFCRERLANFKVPDTIDIVEDFPRTAVGKIQKHLIRQSVLQ
ncbi:AMP-binding protein [Edaphobacillus lindanitolerans]|uniref:Crotonobetaine/carnitine-CoA ligase n=1 Tax=Edaphobacillus lindanitolerans TaxID=550447 RepID=A0A1U7PIA6_9BACI|nr:AMP-binding protein [Edaphobacillus lindanitolerans]SIT72676.1 crotonobetaine/carnitine-CoA ligase [Edaphobacillus lindanitolerans]